MSVAQQSRHLTAPQIQNMISVRTRGAIEDLQVEVDDRSIILSGRTDYWFLKQLAQQVVLELPVSEALRNEIQVRVP